MPVNSGPPLRKVTLNLYEQDCLRMEEVFGHGWTTVLRDWMHDNVRRHAQPLGRAGARTLGDLAND